VVSLRAVCEDFVDSAKNFTRLCGFVLMMCCRVFLRVHTYLFSAERLSSLRHSERRIRGGEDRGHVQGVEIHRGTIGEKETDREREKTKREFSLCVYGAYVCRQMTSYVDQVSVDLSRYISMRRSMRGRILCAMRLCI
jgi:hypothetical protein